MFEVNNCNFSKFICSFGRYFNVMQRLEHRFMMNRLGRRLYHCLMFYNR